VDLTQITKDTANDIFNSALIVTETVIFPSLKYDFYFLFSYLFCIIYLLRLLLSLSAATTVQTRFDASTLHDCPQVAMETGMVDDGSGDKMVS